MSNRVRQSGARIAKRSHRSYGGQRSHLSSDRENKILSHPWCNFERLDRLATAAMTLLEDREPVRPQKKAKARQLDEDLGDINTQEDDNDVLMNEVEDGEIADVDMIDIDIGDERPEQGAKEQRAESQAQLRPESEPESEPEPEPEVRQGDNEAAQPITFDASYKEEIPEQVGDSFPRKDEDFVGAEDSADVLKAADNDDDNAGDDNGLGIRHEDPINNDEDGPARDAYDLKLETAEIQGTELAPNFEVPRQTQIAVTVNGEPAGHQLLDTTKRIAKMLLRESWQSRIPPAPIDYRGHVRKVATQNNVNAIIAHVKAEEKAKGHGCRRCEDGKGPFTSCRVHPLWAPNGACTSCLHGGKNGYCSFVKQTKATIERREKEETVQTAKQRRAERVRILGTRFAGMNGPMMPREDMTEEEAEKVAEEATLWAEYMELWRQNRAEAKALSPVKRR